ncbi:hypothetical protein L6372_004468 [Salmonella enterica subsp. enterica serovar Java]|nr:hypothetical protein [Salmonella enterica subsp. enterica serovar Java]EJM8670422.1 hypothetical protein [Salmonella enterica]EIU8379450.1 hypothetical protein [Salmonella enterica subsp. enterica serovar Java]EIU8440392.1 hypothetical protein [Salmonella enterica subsp. enterica serovar Java]EIV8164532.1 hypothetical protein [Salmonella enterica subsp. enterica serovar Java]
MATPLRASENYLIGLGELLESGTPIDEFTYRYVMRHFSSSLEGNDVSAVGFAYALNGEDEAAFEHFSKHLRPDSPMIANNFVVCLFRRCMFRKMHEVIFDLADTFGGKMLSMMAACEAFRIGDLELIKKYIEYHCTLLTDNEDRAGAEEYMQELIGKVSSCYESKVCTPAQFALLGHLAYSILERHRYVPHNLDLFSSMGGDYRVQVEKATPEKIVEMNAELAELICEQESLDDCELTARFTVEREEHKKDTYDYRKY